MSDQDPYAYSLSGKAAKFESKGDTTVGEIVSVRWMQQTDFMSKKPKFYDDGNPMMQRVITLQTDEHEDDDDDGVRTIYSRGQMERAIGDALKRAKVRALADGGKLGIKFVGTAEPAAPGMSGAKQYTAKYEPPTQQHYDDPDDEPF